MSSSGRHVRERSDAGRLTALIMRSVVVLTFLATGNAATFAVEPDPAAAPPVAAEEAPLVPAELPVPAEEPATDPGTVDPSQLPRSSLDVADQPGPEPNVAGDHLAPANAVADALRVANAAAEAVTAAQDPAAQVAPSETTAGAPPPAIATAAADPQPSIAAQDASLAVTASVFSDGTPSFANWEPGDISTPMGTLVPPCPTFHPGDDCEEHNLIVRTMDTTTIRVTWSVNPLSGPSDDVQVKVRLNTTPSLPQIQLVPGFALSNNPTDPTSDCPGGFVVDPDRQGFTCGVNMLGTGFTLSTSKAFDVVVIAPMSTPHGSLFSLTATITEAGNPDDASATSQQVLVSAGPRWELVKQAVSVGDTVVAGPNGGTGVNERWAIGIRSLTNDYRGLSQLAEPIVIDDFLVSFPNSPQLLQGCSAASFSQWPSLVSSVFAPAQQLEAPSVTCTQSGGANGPITATLSGIDWGRITQAPVFPGGAPRGLVTYFVLDTWISETDITAAGSGGIDKCNEVETSQRGTAVSGSWIPAAGTVSTWAPVDISGNLNLLGMPALEPVGNNGACVHVVAPPPPAPVVAAGFSKNPVTPGNGGAVDINSQTQSQLTFSNNGNQPYPADAVICDKWDDSRFNPASPFFTVPTQPFDPMVRVEFGEGNWGGPPDGPNWFRQATSYCSNATFVTGPSPQVTGTLSSFNNNTGLSVPAGSNMVRITILSQIPVGRTVDLRLNWVMVPGTPIGQEFRNYSAVFFPHVQQWQTSNCPGAANQSCPGGLTRGTSAGSWSHWWTTVAGTVQVVKSRVDNFTFSPGGTVTWRIRVRGVAPTAGATGQTNNVVLEDTLPLHFGYRITSTSGLAEPSCTAAPPPPPPGQQVCTWVLPNPVTWTAPGVFTVDFTFQTDISPFAPPMTYRNVVRATTPDDPTPLGGLGQDDRVSFADALVLRSVAAVIDKLVVPAVASPGGTTVYTLRYGNPSSTDVPSMDAIDILPFNGDPRGSVFGPGAFVLTGVTGSLKPAPVEQIWVSSQPPAQLDQLDGPVDGYLDPAATLVGPVGGANFPCQLSQVGTTGCPTLDQVTALRFFGPGTPAAPFLRAGTGPFSITLTYAVGPCVLEDRMVNSWFARFEGLLPIRFQAGAAGVSGCVPSIGVVKDVQDADGSWVQSTTVTAGSDVTWRVTVTNTGGTPLTDLVFTDPAFAGCAATGAAAAPAVFAPGASFSFFCTDDQVTAGYTNTVTVTGTGPDDRRVTASDNAVVDTREAPPVIGVPPPKSVVAAPKPAVVVGSIALTGSDLAFALFVALTALGLGAVFAAAGRRRDLLVPEP